MRHSSAAPLRGTAGQRGGHVSLPADLSQRQVPDDQPDPVSNRAQHLNAIPFIFIFVCYYLHIYIINYYLYFIHFNSFIFIDIFISIFFILF